MAASCASVHAQLLTKDQYLSQTNSALDAVISQTATGRQFPVQIGANLFFAHEVEIASTPLSVLQSYVDGLRDAGVQRIDINPGLWPWRAGSSDPAAADAIAKYDAIIHYIRQSNLRLELNPQYSRLYYKFTSFDDWLAAAGPVYVELARRYQPDIFVVVHEPTTMAARMLAAVSADQWRAAAQSLASQVKAVAPRTRIAAGGLYSEAPYYNAFLTLPEIDTMTIDIYSVGFNLSALQTYSDMITRAQNAGKPVYIEETWRPTYFVGGPGQTLEDIISSGIGDASFEALDQKWLTAMTQFASSLGVEAITPFWTQTYFLYVTDPSSSALDPVYNSRVGTAAQAGQRTGTEQTARALANTRAVKHLTVNSASFEDGAVAPESIVTISPYPGTVFSTTTGLAASASLPTHLAGVGVTFLDKSGATLDAPLISVSPSQINCVVPSGLAPGPATVTVNGTSGASTGSVLIASVAPAFYSANQNGSGLAAAYVIRVRNGVQTQEFVFSPDPAGSRAPAPIDLGPPTDQVFLSLYGTGLRGGSNQVSVKVGGQDLPVQFAGAQQQYPGLDQVNVQIPRSLIGQGEVPVSVVVGGKYANLVTITIK